jgi:hypothetical protein
MKASLNIKLLFVSAVVAACCDGCKKLPDGFLSPNIRYEESPIVVQRGRVKVSSALNFDGSSRPGRVRLVHIYDKATGAIVDDIFLEKYTIKTWKGLYDPKTDTTLELIQAKQEDTEVTPIRINESSGQLEANFTTLYAPVGHYVFDLEISNENGSRLYDKIGEFQLVDAKPYEADPEIGTNYIRMIRVGNESQGENLTGVGNVQTEIERTADAPNKIIVKMVDKNGVPFNPKEGEIARRPNTGNNPTPPYLQTLQDYSLKTELFDDRMEFTYGVNPFPLNSLGNGFNIYYRIPAQFFSHDNQAKFPDGEWSANPRFPFRVYVPGTYVITFKAMTLTRK